MSVSINRKDQEGTKRERKYAKWNSGKKDEYITKIGVPEVDNRVKELRELLVGNRDTTVLEGSVVELCKVLVKAGEGHIHTVRTGSAGRGKERASAEWYDRECADQRRVFEESEKHYHNDQTEENRVSMCMQRNIYRKLCRNKKGSTRRQKVSG